MTTSQDSAGAAGSVSPSPVAGPRSVADWQAEVADARADLVANVARLRAAVQPQAILQRGVRSAVGWFVGENGIRPERVAIAGAVAVGLVVVVALSRRRR